MIPPPASTPTAMSRVGREIVDVVIAGGTAGTGITVPVGVGEGVGAGVGEGLGTCVGVGVADPVGVGSAVGTGVGPGVAGLVGLGVTAPVLVGLGGGLAVSGGASGAVVVAAAFAACGSSASVKETATPATDRKRMPTTAAAPARPSKFLRTFASRMGSRLLTRVVLAVTGGSPATLPQVHSQQ